MRALITGGAGFIGSTLALSLTARGHEVHVVDDLSRGQRDNIPPGANFYETDIVGGSMAELVSAIQPEIVFHEAAQVDVRQSVRDPIGDTRINVMGTVNLLQACALNSVKRFIFASSGGAIYGDTTQLPTPEEHHCAPASAYGAAKLAGEAYGEVFRHVYGLEVVALRYGNVYGPRQDPHGEAGVVAIFTEALLDGRDAVINGDGRQTRDYVHVDDVVVANLMAAQTEHLGVYNIGTGRECDVNSLYLMMASACGVEQPASHGPAKLGEQRRSCLDIARAERLLDWRPSVRLEDGISGTVAWFRRQRGDLSTT